MPKKRRGYHVLDACWNCGHFKRRRDENDDWESCCRLDNERIKKGYICLAWRRPLQTDRDKEAAEDKLEEEEDARQEAEWQKKLEESNVLGTN